MKPEVKDEPTEVEEATSPIKEFSINCERVDVSQNSSCDYSLSQFKDEECSLPVKSENETESENNFVDVKGEPDDEEYENEAANDSEEDIPLSKRKKVEIDSEDEAPLFQRKKAKTEKKAKKKKRMKEESDDEDDESDYGKSKKKKAKKETVVAPAKVRHCRELQRSFAYWFLFFQKPATKSMKNEPVSPTKGRKKKKAEDEPEVWKW